MASIFVGGVVGAAMGEVAKFTVQAVNDGRQFVPTLEMNQETLNALTPLVEKIEYYDNLLGNPKKERLQLKTLLRETEELIRKCTKELSPWKFLCSRYYRTRLLKKNHKKVESYLNNIVPVEIKRDLMEVKADLKLIIDFFMRMMNIENFGGSQNLGLRCIPEEPVVKYVGMDESLNNLKIELIKDGVSAHVLNENTLAKKVCWDSQIKGRFGGNIFFVTLSKTPNLIMNIVQTLWQQYGLQVPEMHNDEDAIIPLRFLLDIFSKNPILLVLDNVWPGSESLIENFVYTLEEHLLHCKILVVSSTAVPFTRYDTQCELYPLDHDHDHDYAVSLFHHFAQLDHSSSGMPDQDLVHEEYLNGQLTYDCIEHPYVGTHVSHGELTSDQSEWEQRLILDACTTDWRKQQGFISHGSNDIMKDTVLWRRKKLSTMVIAAATVVLVTWVLMEVYQFNFLTLISWLTIFFVASIFIKWLFRVSTKEDWPVFVGVMVGLLAISCMGFLKFIFLGARTEDPTSTELLISAQIASGDRSLA